jgi:hypothetical protein
MGSLILVFLFTVFLGAIFIACLFVGDVMLGSFVAVVWLMWFFAVVIFGIGDKFD